MIKILALNLLFFIQVILEKFTNRLEILPVGYLWWRKKAFPLKIHLNTPLQFNSRIFHFLLFLGSYEPKLFPYQHICIFIPFTQCFVAYLCSLAGTNLLFLENKEYWRYKQHTNPLWAWKTDTRKKMHSRSYFGHTNLGSVSWHFFPL